MVLYREKKKKSPWLWVGAIVAFVALLAVVAIVLSLTSRSSDDDRLTDAVTAMSSQLDVLRISHYTGETLAEGPESPEYQAALDDMERIRSEWASVEGSVPPETAAEVQGLIDQLDQAIRDQAPVSEVDSLAESLIEKLGTV